MKLLSLTPAPSASRIINVTLCVYTVSSDLMQQYSMLVVQKYEIMLYLMILLIYLQSIIFKQFLNFNNFFSRFGEWLNRIGDIYVCIFNFAVTESMIKWKARHWMSNPIGYKISALRFCFFVVAMNLLD